KRFDIYGNLSFKKTPVLVWKEHEKSAFVNKVEAYKMLRDAFINNPKIRREMNSYVDDAKIDIKEKGLGQKISLKKELENAISKASQKLGKALTIDPIEVGSAFQTGFYKVLELSSAEELDIDFWVEHINVDGIDKIFKEYNTNYREGFKKSIEKLAVETKLKKQERQSLYLKMTREIKKFIANVKDLLRNSFIKAAYAAGLGDKVNAVLSGSINTKNLNLLLERAQQSSSLNVSLFSSNCPDLFEEMLCCELYCYQNSCKNSADKIHAIYHGIEVDLGKENSDKKSNVMELDALVIKKTGNLLNFEAKTHFSSAPRKDMFSRIKNIKDYGGAKAKTYLVFPLTRDDIERIKDWVPGEEFNFCATPDGWKNYIKTTEIEEDIKIIGFDEIGKELDDIR
ncbi:MAG TPA: hypothetical protein PLB16_07235, partial [bacterium]|nr:hypothetical protein [bacterium]